MMEGLFAGVEEKEVPKGHVHWMATCNADDCGFSRPFGSNPPMSYGEAVRWVEELNRRVSREMGRSVAAYRLEVEVVP